MKAWEIWSYQPAGWPESHPAVIVSGPARVAHKPELNIIMCSTKEATRPPLPNEIILDIADGLNWPTPAQACRIRVIRVRLEPLHYPSHTPPDAHRRFNFNLRCAS